MAEFTQQQLLDLVNTAHVAPGNARVRAITARVVSDLFKTIDELDVQPDEFWRAVDWLARLGVRPAGLDHRRPGLRPTAGHSR
jgi:catechol 1,2-dioxygenase